LNGVHAEVEFLSSRMSRETVNLGVEVVQVVQRDRLRPSSAISWTAELVRSVAAQDQVLQPQQQFLRERLARRSGTFAAFSVSISTPMTRWPGLSLVRVGERA
jgi:hypothetical protein